MPIDVQELEDASGRALAGSEGLDQMRAYGLDTEMCAQLVRRLAAYVRWDADRSGADSAQAMAEAAVVAGLLTGFELGLDRQQRGGDLLS